MLHFNLDCPQRTEALSVAPCASLDAFVALARANPGDYCTACTRTDSDRYAELRQLVEAYQNAKCYEDDEPLKALREWSHH